MTIDWPAIIHIAVVSAFAVIMVTAAIDGWRQLRRPVEPFSEGEPL